MLICLVHRLQPFIVGFLTGYFHRQVGEPAVRRCAVSMLYAGGDIHHVAGLQWLRRLTPFLIEAPSGQAN